MSNTDVTTSVLVLSSTDVAMGVLSDL